MSSFSITPKDRNRDHLFTNLLDYYSHQWTDINVWYVKWKLESSSIISLSFWFTTKLFSATNKASRALEAKLGITRLLKRDLRPYEWWPLFFFSFVSFILWRLFISARETPSNRHGTWSKRPKTEIIRIDAAPPGGQILQIFFAQKL